MSGDNRIKPRGIERRNLLKAGIAAPALFAASSAQSAMADGVKSNACDAAKTVETPSDLIVSTDKGKVRGYISSGIRTFKGVPYGAPTGGENRFMPPKPRAPWSEVRDAFDYGAICPQEAPGPGGRFGFMLRPSQGYADEDCLNLNIWSPGLDGEKRAVMVWIHGGNYTTGSSYSLACQDGESLARKGDVVVVSVNHRLNILGHMDLAAIGATDELSGSVNVGLLDLVRALEWVGDNIEAFGGDPGNVTLFGQSGGGLKIAHLSGMPAAKGLFQKAISQSGSQVEPFDDAMTAPLAQNVMEELSLEQGDVAGLQAVPIDRLQAAAQKVLADWRLTSGFADIWRTVGWAPRIEAKTLPYAPYSPEAGDVSRNIALMAGSARHEFSLAVFNPSAENMTMDELRASLKSMYKDPDAVISVAQETYPEEKPVGLYSVISAAYFNRTNGIKQVQAKAALGGAPAFLYQFAWRTPVLNGTPKAYHCAELPFVFASAEREPQATGGGADALVIEEQVAGAWIAFAKTGNPSHSVLPDWVPVEPDTVPTMIFDTTPRLDANTDQTLRNMVHAQRK